MVWRWSLAKKTGKPKFHLLFPPQKSEVEVKSLNRVWLFVTPWTVAHQAPLSMEFSRQDYWSGFHFLLRGELPDSGIELRLSALQADSSLSEPPETLRKMSNEMGTSTTSQCRGLWQADLDNTGQPFRTDTVEMEWSVGLALLCGPSV